MVVIVKNSVTALGALVGAALGVTAVHLLFVRPGPGLPALGLLALAALIFTAVVYIVANAATRSAGVNVGSFARGMLIGSNTGLNAYLGALIAVRLFGTGAGYIVALSVAVVTTLAVFKEVANAEVYQGVLGWLNWLLPMSWLVVGVGFAMFLLNLLGGLVFGLIFRVGFFRIRSFSADGTTGTFFVHGGWISDLNPIDTAFNMGNFSFIDSATTADYTEHEAGHTLNLAVFGSLFHFIGAIDENVTGGGRDAFSERLAESNDPATGQANIIPMWI